MSDFSRLMGTLTQQDKQATPDTHNTEFNNLLNDLLGDKPSYTKQPSGVNYMSNSDTGVLDLIKKYEGFKNKAYKLPGEENYTIGYGTHRADITPDMTIDAATAEKYLLEDVQEAQDAVDRLVDVDLSEKQKAALTSLIYNVGQGTFAGSKARKALNKGDLDAFIFEAFDPERGFVRDQNEEILPGLVKRRQEEKELFSKNST